MRDGIELGEGKAKKLSEFRLEEAKILYKEKKFSGAYYLAGYSIELALKAAICKKFKSGTIPDKKFVNDLYTNDLEKLMALSSLKSHYSGT